MNLKRNGNGNGNGPSRDYWKLGLFAVAALLVLVLLFRQIGRLTGERGEVWVAAHQLESGAVVSPEDLEKVRKRVQEIPQGAFADLERIVGQTLHRPKASGAAFAAADFQPAGSSNGGVWIAGEVPAGRVLTTLAVSPLAIPYPQLLRGDRLELVTANGTVARDAFFLGWIKPAPGAAGGNGSGSGTGKLLSRILRPPPGRGEGAGQASISLLLALHPDHVIPVAQAQASRLRLSLVLHGRAEVQSGELLELPSPSSGEVELIAGDRRERVAL